MLSESTLETVLAALDAMSHEYEMYGKSHRDMIAIAAARAEIEQGQQPSLGLEMPDGLARKFHSLPASELVELRNAYISYFYHRVCRAAEKNMALTGTVSGAHWNAMKQVLAQMNIDVDNAPAVGQEGE